MRIWRKQRKGERGERESTRAGKRMTIQGQRGRDDDNIDKEGGELSVCQTLIHTILREWASFLSAPATVVMDSPFLLLFKAVAEHTFTVTGNEISPFSRFHGFLNEKANQIATKWKKYNRHCARFKICLFDKAIRRLGL